MSELTLVAAGLILFDVKITVVLKDGGGTHQSCYSSLEVSSAAAFTEGTRRAESHFGQRIETLSVNTFPAYPSSQNSSGACTPH